MFITVVIPLSDNHTPEVRSYNMSRIRSTNTKPEELIRKALFKKGFRFRKNDKRYPGKPDIVLPKHKTIIFVNGCFWHMHDCPNFVFPKSRLDYWKPKLERNVQRDLKNYADLKSQGWNIIVVWECQLKKDVFDLTISEITNSILNHSTDTALRGVHKK